MAAATAVTSLATGYVTSGSGWDARMVVATLIGMALAGLLLARTLGLMAERAVVRERANRAAEDARDLEIQREVLDVREREMALRERELAARQGEAALIETERAAGAVQDWMAEVERAQAVPRHAEPRYENRQEPEYEEPEPPYEEPVDQFGRTRAEAWRVYHENHPDVLASWGEQNGRWPNCPGPECDPRRDAVAQEVDTAVTEYLDEELRYEDRREGPVVYPRPTHQEVRGWLIDPDPAAEERMAAPPRRFDYRTGLDEPRREAEPWNAFEPVRTGRAALDSVPVPLPPRDAGPPRDGYQDPGPYSSFVPVTPGRYDPDATEVIGRVDAGDTQVIPAQS